MAITVFEFSILLLSMVNRGILNGKRVSIPKLPPNVWAFWEISGQEQRSAVAIIRYFFIKEVSVPEAININPADTPRTGVSSWPLSWFS